MNKQCINIIIVGIQYLNSPTPPPPHESIQYVMDLKTAGPPKVVEEQK